jgi:hypothetical protein
MRAPQAQTRGSTSRIFLSSRAHVLRASLPAFGNLPIASGAHLLGVGQRGAQGAAGEGQPNEQSGLHLLVITTLACFSEGELAVSRIFPGLAVACTTARHSPLKACRRFDL